MRWLGHLLLWVGFVAAAYTSLSSLENPEDKWSTIAWPQYVVCLAVGAAGVAILRATRGANLDESMSEAEYTNVRESIDTLCKVVDRMVASDERVPSQVVQTIDDECSEPLARFAESRTAIIQRSGLDAYAKVMTEFASAERYINRTWSAAADGYIDEVDRSLNRVQQHLGRAKELLD